VNSFCVPFHVVIIQIVFADMIELLYKQVYPCDDIDGPPPPSPYTDCSDYIDSTVDDIRTLSYEITAKWAVIIGFTMLGNTLLFYGFGTASERMNKRVRDVSFESLIRQEIAYFDEHTVGFITSQLQDDAALLQAFSGEPVRTLIINLSSVLVGLAVSFYFMWYVS
jgi:ATP-binding cassette subfamily B (MDR/TAP) protein 1